MLSSHKHQPRILFLGEKSMCHFLLAIKHRFHRHHFDVIQGGGDHTNLQKADKINDYIHQANKYFKVQIDVSKVELKVIVDNNPQFRDQHVLQEFKLHHPHTLIVLASDEQEDLYPEELINQYFELNYPEKPLYTKSNHQRFKTYLRTVGIKDEVKLTLATFVGQRITKRQLKENFKKIHDAIFGQ